MKFMSVPLMHNIFPRGRPRHHVYNPKFPTLIHKMVLTSPKCFITQPKFRFFPRQASGPDGRATSPGPPVALKDNEIAALAESAARIAQKLPHYEPKRMNLKKQICREIEVGVKARV